MQQRAGGTFVEYHTDVPLRAGRHPVARLAPPAVGRAVPRQGQQPADELAPRRPHHRPLASQAVRRNRSRTCRSGRSPPTTATRPSNTSALQRAYRTYTEVHGLLIQILKWALANRYLRPTDQNIVDQLPLAHEQRPPSTAGQVRAVAAEEIPPTEMVERTRRRRRPALRAPHGHLIYLLAYAGPGSASASRCATTTASGSGPGRLLAPRDPRTGPQVARRTLPPKWRKRRWTFAPHWLTDDLDRLLADTAPGELLFPSPGRKVRNAAGRRARSTPGSTPTATGATHREKLKIAADTPGWPERHDWWPPERRARPGWPQSERRWLWPVHSLRHVAATYQLNVLGLDPDDVAKFLGHRSGVQVWEMYVRVRPDLFGRAAEASRRAGDPRASGVNGLPESQRAAVLGGMRDG